MKMGLLADFHLKISCEAIRFIQLRVSLSESELFYQQPLFPVTAGAESHMS